MTDKHPVGRPEVYTRELATELCSRVAKGNSLRKVCEMGDMPGISTVYRWFDNHDGFREQYAYAKEDSADSDHDRLDEIAEKVLDGECEPQAARVAADIIKWSAGKKKPKKYGDTKNINLNTKKDLTELSDDDLDREIAQRQAEQSRED